MKIQSARGLESKLKSTRGMESKLKSAREKDSRPQSVTGIESELKLGEHRQRSVKRRMMNSKGGRIGKREVRRSDRGREGSDEDGRMADNYREGSCTGGTSGSDTG